MSADRIKTLLLSTKRQGMEALIDYMEGNGFFTEPCSTSHHLSKEATPEIMQIVQSVYGITKKTMDIERRYRNKEFY